MSTLEQLLGHDIETNPITDYLTAIENGIRSQPRSRQKLIGPSEIGTDCPHCLAAKLAGWEETERDVAWLPFIGTAVHAELAGIFETDNKRSMKNGGRRRWRVEQRVEVGTIGGHHISGTADLYDTLTGTVLDHKIVGAQTLRTAKAAPKPVYRVQGQLYGLGMEHAGHTPKRVAIAHLPRNAMSLAQAVIHVEDYNPQIAHEALERANRIHANLTTLAAVSAEIRDSWITSQDRATGCFSCPRYPDWTTQPSALSAEFAITPTTERKKAVA